MEEIIQIQVNSIDGLMVSILVLFLGFFLNRKIRFLGENFIPPAVTGGLICSGVVAVLHSVADIEITFDMELRDTLLLLFFSTVGLSAKLRSLVSGGKALALLVLIAGVFLIIQDSTGVGLAYLFGAHPGYGLMGGSISLAGGHGTAIAWGGEAEAAGLIGAAEVGIAFATFGLIAGGLIGGPIAGRLIKRYDLKPSADATGPAPAEAEQGAGGGAGALTNILTGLLVLAVCVALGRVVNEFLSVKGVLLPGFLTSMFVGVVITNFSDVLKIQIHPETVNKFGEVSLNVFLAMSLMSMKLWTLAGAAGPIMIVLIIQILVMTIFAVFIVFRVMGRDYDAAVISAGFSGLGLGATPVAIANMDAVTRRYGPSVKAFLIVPLVGAFFIDLLNAFVIKLFIGILG